MYGNGQCTKKPTNRTRHIDIKYFALCDWIESDLIHLERVDTAINTADHLTKALTRILFHRHADYLLGHVPPKYSPVYDSMINNVVQTDDKDDNSVKYVPTSFTTPATAKANRIYTPTFDDINGNPWTTAILWNEEYNAM